MDSKRPLPEIARARAQALDDLRLGNRARQTDEVVHAAVLQNEKWSRARRGSQTCSGRPLARQASSNSRADLPPARAALPGAATAPPSAERPSGRKYQAARCPDQTTPRSASVWQPRSRPLSHARSMRRGRRAADPACPSS
eukprot:9490991-Pyramimonas_sp.AAC.1